MYKDLEKIKDMMMYKALEVDDVAHINGEDLTITIASEECAEVIQTLSKIKRYGLDGDYKDNLQEEVANILVCISELLALGYIDMDKVEEWHTYKADREIERARERKEQKR